MQRTNKYDQMINEGSKPYVAGPANGKYQHQQSSPTPATRDFDVIATEVRAIISKAWEADEPKNVQS
jgi:hypothetical protein